MSALAQTATVAWGYTMADLDRFAWTAVRRHPNTAADMEERHATAWHAIVELLYDPETREPPRRGELINAGMLALNHAADSERHHHGLDHQRNRAPNFIKYWRPIKQGHDDGFTEHLCEVMALPAVLSVLTPKQYQVIVTLAAFDNDAAAAARAIGMTYKAYHAQLSRTRARLKDAWFGDETPVTRGTPTDTCRAGHPRSKHGKLRPNGKWECRVCKRNAARRRRAVNR